MASPVHNSATAADGRYEFLDGLRAIAALLVAVQHGLEILFGPQIAARLPVNLGETGVVLFFFVSGVVIPLSLARHGSLGRFWIKRVFRLYPAYWASLVGCLMLAGLGLFPPPFLTMRSAVLGALANMTMLQSLMGVPSAIGVYWTLPLELLFYGLCSLLWLTGLLRRPMLCASAATALLLVSELAAATQHRSIPAGRAGLILVALFGAAVFSRLQVRTSHLRLALLSLGGTCAILFGLWLRFAQFPVTHEVAAPRAGVVMLSWLVAVVILFAAVLFRAWPLPVQLLWLGRVSYSYYLWHIPVLMALALVFRNRGVPAWLLLVAALLMTGLVAEVCFWVAERPGIACGAKLADRPAGHSNASATS